MRGRRAAAARRHVRPTARAQAYRSRSTKRRAVFRVRARAPHASRRAPRGEISIRARSPWEVGWPMGLEPTTTGITTLDSTFELRPPLEPESTRLACPTRLELVTPSLEGWCSIRLSYGQSASKLPIQKNRTESANSWSGREDLNLRHLAPKASALPDCATPRKRRQMILLAHL